MTGIYHWFLTMLVLTVATLALHWLGPDHITSAPAVDLRLHTAEGSRVAPQWQATLWNILRWPFTLVVAGASLGLFLPSEPPALAARCADLAWGGVRAGPRRYRFGAEPLGHSSNYGSGLCLWAATAAGGGAGHATGVSPVNSSGRSIQR